MTFIIRFTFFATIVCCESTPYYHWIILTLIHSYLSVKFILRLKILSEIKKAKYYHLENFVLRQKILMYTVI